MRKGIVVNVRNQCRSQTLRVDRRSPIGSSQPFSSAPVRSNGDWAERRRL